MTALSNKKDKYFGLTVTIVYTAMVTLIMCFHEPWLDEAQSWLIARDASFGDILFVLPHYEGHPPLWHLLLSVPAKLGVPYEVGLKGVQLVFAVLFVALLEFRSPFGRGLKAVIPFSYFFFYQQGVMSRPYSMLGCALLLCAITFKDKNKKSLGFVLSEMFLCLTSAYGIAAAGGLTLAWLAEIIRERKKSRLSKKDLIKLAVLLAMLAVFALALIIEIMPVGRTYAVKNSYKQNNMLVCFLYCLFMLPAEAFYTSFSKVSLLSMQSFSVTETVLGAVISAAVWAAAFVFCKKRRISAYLTVPYLCFCVIGSYYISAHHYGIITAFAVFILWIGCEKKPISLPKPDKKDIKTLIPTLVLVCMALVNLSWSATSAINDIMLPVGSGRDSVKWIKQNGLEDKKWLTMWDLGIEFGTLRDTNRTPYVIDMNPYFERNLAYNMYLGKSYLTHISADDDEMERYIKEIKSKGEPDFLLGYSADIQQYIKDELGFESKYVPVYFARQNMVYKYNKNPAGFTIAAKEDIYKNNKALRERKAEDFAE